MPDVRPLPRPSLDRMTGALVGTALGDAVGAPFEGQRRPATREVEEHLRASTTLRWTDDAHMTLALAESLVATAGELDPQHLGDTFARWYADEPWRGYGSGPPQVFSLARDGQPYEQAAASLFDGSGSFGNGAAMRCAPVAVLAAPDLEWTVDLARRQARITHTHPEGVDGAVLLAGALCLTLASEGPAGRAADRLAPLADHLGSQAFRDGLAARLRNATATSHTADVTGPVGVDALRSVFAALDLFLTTPDEPLTVLRRAVLLGGDTDTVAAMAGALVGAAVGVSGLPAHLLHRLEDRERFEDAARRLAALRGGQAPAAGRERPEVDPGIRPRRAATASDSRRRPPRT
jgi:poly(ADP-ribose) glycohydrolase ARH3